MRYDRAGRNIMRILPHELGRDDRKSIIPIGRASDEQDAVALVAELEGLRTERDAAIEAGDARREADQGEIAALRERVERAEAARGSCTCGRKACVLVCLQCVGREVDAASERTPLELTAPELASASEALLALVNDRYLRDLVGVSPLQGQLNDAAMRVGAALRKAGRA